MDAVSFVPGADGFQQVVAGNQRRGVAEGDRLGVERWVIDDHLRVQVAEVTAAHALSHTHGLASGVARKVQRSPRIKPRRLDDQRVAFPHTNGVADPCGLRIHRQRAAVPMDLAWDVTVASIG